MHRLAMTLLGFAALFTLAVALAQNASAHAMVVGSLPANGADLSAAPTRVQISFDEPVGIDGVGYLHVVDSAGRRVDRGSATHPNGDATTVQVALDPALGRGRYTESYRVISADSHPITGAITFGVGPVAPGQLAGPADAPPTANAAAGVGFDVVRWISFAGLVLLFGGWLAGTLWPQGRRDRRTRALAVAGAWGLTLGAVLEVLVQGPYSAGSGLSHIADPALLRDTLHSEFGTAHLWRLALVIALSYVLWTPRRLPRRITTTLTVLLGIGIAVTFAASGHAWAEHPRLLVAGSDSLHVLAMAIWLGGLVHLCATVLRSEDPEVVRAVLPGFSQVAFGCVITLAVTGSYQAVRGVVTVDALFHTRYGQLILVKVALFLVTAGLGNASRALVWRRYLQPVAYAYTWADADRVHPLPDARWPRRAVVLESMVGAAVLAVTSVLIAEPPGNVAIATQHQQARSASVQLGGGRAARVTLSPGDHGPVTVTVTLSGTAPVQQVTAALALPSQQLGPISTVLTRTAPLSYTAAGVLLPAAGLWTVDLTVQSSMFDATTASVSIRLY